MRTPQKVPAWSVFWLWPSGVDDDVDDDENDDYQWLRDEESALDASTTIQWTISAPDRLAVLYKRWLHRESVDDGCDVDNDDISEDDDISSRQTRCTFQKMRSLHTVLMTIRVW